MLCIACSSWILLCSGTYVVSEILACTGGLILCEISLQDSLDYVNFQRREEARVVGNKVQISILHLLLR